MVKSFPVCYCDSRATGYYQRCIWIGAKGSPLRRYFMNELLGNRIKELRNARHLKQEQVAELAGISRQKYIRIENGTNNITLEVLARIAKVLDVTVGDITKILDEPSMVTYRNGNGNDSSKMIVDMLDFFYANKHLYMKLQQNDNIQR